MTVFAHTGQAPGPHDIWLHWQRDPLVVLTILVVVALYAQGVRYTDSRRRRTAFALGITSLALALLSPLDAAAQGLASAHMVQHLVLTFVSAPLLVAARPGPAIRRSLPARLGRPLRVAERTLGLGRAGSPGRIPATALIVATATFWIWHARHPYTLALRSDVVHALSHLSYFAAGLIVSNVVRTAGRPGRPHPAAAMGLLFALGLQSTLLAALMTFAGRPWYEPYLATTPAWGLEPLTDQQLAGLVMWFPGAAVCLASSLWLLHRWLASSE